MIGNNGVTFRRFDPQQVEAAVFLDDIENPVGVSCGTTNAAAGEVREIPAGQVMARCADGLFRAVVKEAVTAVVAGVAAVPVADARQFVIGDRVTKTGDPYSLASVSAIDYATNTLTLSTTVTLATTDFLEVNPSRIQAATAGAGGTGVNTVGLATGKGALFTVGQSVYLKTSSATVGLRTITGISTDTLTLDGATFNWAAGGEVISTGALGGKLIERPYRITVTTHNLDYGIGVRPDNIIVEVRTMGKVRERVVRGLTDEVLAVMRPMLMLDYTTD